MTLSLAMLTVTASLQLDAAFIAKTLADAMGKPVSIDEYPAADFNGDGKITALDAAAIAKHLAEQSIGGK